MKQPAGRKKNYSTREAGRVRSSTGRVDGTGRKKSVINISDANDKDEDIPWDTDHVAYRLISSDDIDANPVQVSSITIDTVLHIEKLIFLFNIIRVLRRDV